MKIHQIAGRKILSGGKPVVDGYGADYIRKHPPGYRTAQICLNCDLPDCIGAKRCRRLKND